MFWTLISGSVSVKQKHQPKTQTVQLWCYVKCDKCQYTYLSKIQVCLLQKVLFYKTKNAFEHLFWQEY